MPAQKTVRHKGRKIGRWLRKPSYKRYLAERRWLYNKARKIAKYIRKHPNWKPTNLAPDIAAIVYRIQN